MLPPPPISTLFPYTTLFRSALLNWFDWLYGIRHVSGVHTQSIPQNSAKSTLDNNYFLEYTYFRKDNNSIWGRDRKSTRLNSSHPSISYAVFCLKKKIIIIKK